jgi:hypothetical protein
MRLLCRGHGDISSKADNPGWTCIMPMHSDLCIGGLIITSPHEGSPRPIGNEQLFLSEIAALTLLLGEAIQDVWPRPSSVPISVRR